VKFPFCSSPFPTREAAPSLLYAPHRFLHRVPPLTVRCAMPPKPPKQLAVRHAVLKPMKHHREGHLQSWCHPHCSQWTPHHRRTSSATLIPGRHLPDLHLHPVMRQSPTNPGSDCRPTSLIGVPQSPRIITMVSDAP
jgi:hypothetical protein